MIRTCFTCGERHEGSDSDVVCEPCRVELMKQPEVKMTRTERFLANENRKALKGSSGTAFVSMLQMFISLILF